MSWYVCVIGPLLAGCLLDLLLGDPEWPLHPVRLIGGWIAWLEKRLRGALGSQDRGLLLAGALLALLTVAVAGGAAFALLSLATRVHFWLWFALETALVYFCLAARSLHRASMVVYTDLECGGLPAARASISRIVGRDTAQMDEGAVVRAAVETVAENSCDGVVAPLFFIALGGAVGGVLYKAVNTLDSMVGYRNERYLLLGRVSARLDDVCNWLPARLAALCMCACAAVLPRFSGRGAWRIWRRDRRNHTSPNSAQTEAACAGALGLQLGGDALYGGQLVRKPTIGDGERDPDRASIRRANRLMYAASLLALVLLLGLRILIYLIIMG